jgi:hypothetical protein
MHFFQSIREQLIVLATLGLSPSAVWMFPARRMANGKRYRLVYVWVEGLAVPIQWEQKADDILVSVWLEGETSPFMEPVTVTLSRKI